MADKAIDLLKEFYSTGNPKGEHSVSHIPTANLSRDCPMREPR